MTSPTSPVRISMGAGGGAAPMVLMSSIRVSLISFSPLNVSSQPLTRTHCPSLNGGHSPERR